MIGSVSAGRRANAFAEAVDEHDRGIDEGAVDGDHEQAQLVQLTGALRSLPRPGLDPEVKSVQRAQLVAAMETAVAEGTVGGREDRLPQQRGAPDSTGTQRATGQGAIGRLRPRTRLGRGLAAGGLSVGVAASAFGGIAAASGDALPGDTLYGLKRGLEDFRLDFADDDADRGRLYLDHASTRLREARRLVERDRSGSLDHESLGEIRRALSGIRHDASEAHRLLSATYERNGRIGLMQSLSTFSDDHRAVWSELRRRLPVQLSDAEQEVTEVFTAMEREVEPLRELFPPVDGEDRRPGGTSGRQGDGSGAGEAPDPSEDTRERGKENGEKPSPSGTDEDRGLLDDGLLGGPSSLPGGGGESDRDDSDAPNPEITLPPLLPDFLPGLGVEAEDDRR